MKIDDIIIQKYLENCDTFDYSDHWVYSSISKGSYLFEEPNPNEKEWVSLLRDKVINDAEDLVPRNARIVNELFPDFYEVSANYPIILTVGCPDPYDAMVLEHNNQLFVVFDLMQFVPYVRDLYEQGEAYDFRRILTHGLLHVCIANKYPLKKNLSYLEELSYIAFDEGFAHALSYQEDIMISKFDRILEEKYKKTKHMLSLAVNEYNETKQMEYRAKANCGNYWDKYAAISGKLYLLKNKENIINIYNEGWGGFVKKILSDV